MKVRRLKTSLVKATARTTKIPRGERQRKVGAVFSSQKCFPRMRAAKAPLALCYPHSDTFAACIQGEI